MALNVAQHSDSKEKVQLSFSAHRTSRKHLYLFRQHLSLLIRDYINGNAHLQADTCKIQQGTVRVFHFVPHNSFLSKSAAYIIWVKKKTFGRHCYLHNF